LADEEFDWCDEDENYIPIPLSGGGCKSIER